MPVFLRNDSSRPGQAVPPDVYASQVDALFSDARSLSIGVLAACLITLSTGLMARQPIVVANAAALAVLGGIRLAAMRRYAAQRTALTDAALHRWEMWYVAGGSVHLLLLGLSCLVTFGVTDDAAAQMASLSIAMAYLVGTPGRSFASRFLVNAQIIVGGVPVLAALVIAGPRYWPIALLVIVPLLLALKTISARLQGIFLSAVLRARDFSALANRFDTALNNMPQGLAMFEPDGAVSVINERFKDLVLAADDRDSPATIGTLLNRFAIRNVTPGHDATALPDAPPLAGEWVQDTQEGFSIALKVQPMRQGGGVVLVEDVTERMRAQASIHYLAHFDELTSLPNRRSFADHVRRHLATVPRRDSALMFIDLDGFKQVNDTLGHRVGDTLLQSVTERLRRFLRPSGVIARFGGDEFVLYQEFDDVRVDAARLASLVIAQLCEPFDILGHRVVVGASIGVAIATGPARHPVDDAEIDLDTLLRNADLALYRAKAEGRRTFRFFDGEMRIAAQNRRNIEKDLGQALVRGEMCLYFQPIFDLKTQRFAVCEALIRWKHPEHGMISPAQFIPIAEEMGLIGEIGEWVLQEATRACALWPDTVRVAVNVSAMQFRQGGLLQSARLALASAGLRPDRLEIEITESSLLQDLPATRTTLLHLREIGIRLALDDFGTGYSSLSYLRSLPFQKVKIDRSFLADLEPGSRSLTLLRGIARLSSDLGMSVVMEGIETAEQVALVVEGAAISQIQGYYYARPMPAELLLPHLEGTRRSAA